MVSMLFDFSATHFEPPRREERKGLCSLLRVLSVFGVRFIRLSDLFPSIFFQIDFPRAIKCDPLFFQVRALLVITGGRAEADFPARVDDAVPGDIVGAIVHRPANRARGARRAQRVRDLSVGGYFAARNFADEGVDAGEKGMWRGRTRIKAIPFHDVQITVSSIRTGSGCSLAILLKRLTKLSTVNPTTLPVLG